MKEKKKKKLFDNLGECDSHLSDCYRPESGFSPISFPDEKKEDLNEMFLKGLAEGLGE